MFEYLNILSLLFISIILSIVIIALSYFLVAQQLDPEKVSAYECGFEPFDDARNTFDIRFYLVAILFIVFDLEISFLFPWVISLQTFSILGIYAMLIFLLILTVGFLYEWRKGALEWN
jgi:NADH:ubiquinone oxidoreductase subunit 3 (subunit A)